MSTDGKFNYIDKSEHIDVSKLAVELCLMTGCDQEQAMMQLMNCDYDLQSAANKILEIISSNKQIDDGWQTINRQKKFKKKEYKVDGESNGDSVKQKMISNRNSKFLNSIPNQKPGNFKNGDRQNYTRSRIKKNRSIRTSKDDLDSQNNNKPTNDSEIGFDLVDGEMRWDNLADIDGGLKDSGTNSVVDCFYSDDDFGFPPQSKDNAYQDIGIQLIADVNNMFKAQMNNDNYSKSAEPQTKKANEPAASSQSNSSDTKFLDECLTHQLPIFGKFSKTDPPKSLPIIPTKPVLFALTIRSRNNHSRLQYNFGVNFSEMLTPSNSVDQLIPQGQFFHKENLVILNELQKKMLSPNNPNFNNISGLSKKSDSKGILDTILQQQKEVAIVFREYPAQSHYSFVKPVNLIPMSNSNSIAPTYPMQMNTEALHADIENGWTRQNHECFIQNSFPTSINMPVPFQ